MRPRENLAPFVIAGLVLTLAILVSFQVYLLREPGRIEAAQAADQAAAVEAGGALFRANCTTCHGDAGQGAAGPALNSKELLNTTSDSILFSLIRTGVPGTVMPAWSQAFGGPMTDEEARELVAYLRSWEPDAPEIQPAARVPSEAQGAAIFAGTCSICHGEEGHGTDQAPALNDPARLRQFDDGWYRDTIAQGRPARGMPTWGTVLSPEQMEDVVALLGAWRQGRTVPSPIPLVDHLTGAQFALERSDPLDAVFHLNEALEEAKGFQADDVQAILDLIQQNDLAGAATQLADMLGAPAASAEQGPELFVAHCSPCHGEQGKGALGPSLQANAFVQAQTDDGLRILLLSGRSGTAMPGFQGRLREEQLVSIIALLREWQE